MERRRHQRYDLEAFVGFVWQDPTGAPKHGEGFLRDISGGGVFVCSNDLPSMGAGVRFEVLVRSVLPDSRLIIQGRGQVSRVEVGLPPQAPTGFATAVTTFALRKENADVIE
jgi:hypothetical protein